MNQQTFCIDYIGIYGKSGFAKCHNSTPQICRVAKTKTNGTSEVICGFPNEHQHRNIGITCAHFIILKVWRSRMVSTSVSERTLEKGLLPLYTIAISRNVFVQVPCVSVLMAYARGVSLAWYCCPIVLSLKGNNGQAYEMWSCPS